MNKQSITLKVNVEVLPENESSSTLAVFVIVVSMAVSVAGYFVFIF